MWRRECGTLLRRGRCLSWEFAMGCRLVLSVDVCWCISFCIYHRYFLLQELAHVFGGKVAPGLKREYGKASVSRVEGCNSPLFAGLPEEFIMWMSHGDKLHGVPEGFKAVGKCYFSLS